MLTRDVTYRDQAANLRGFLAYEEMAPGRRPGVLVIHEGLGLNEHATQRARRLAGLGYVALAADMFGDRRQARDLQEARELIGELRDDPAKLRARARAALATLATLRQVDAERLAAVGVLFWRLGCARASARWCCPSGGCQFPWRAHDQSARKPRPSAGKHTGVHRCR